MYNIRPLRVIFLLLLLIICLSASKAQSTAGARCKVNLVRTIDTPHDYIFLDMDIFDALGAQTYITFSVLVSNERTLDFTITVPRDTCELFDQSGVIVFPADTSFSITDSSYIHLGNQLIRITGEMILDTGGSSGIHHKRLPVGIRINYY